MKEGDDKKDSKNKLRRSDKTLWDAYTKDIIALNKVNPKKTIEIIDDPEDAEDLYSAITEIEELNLSPRQVTSSSDQPAQLDKRTEEKLRKGKMPIDGRIDLHGLSRAQAHEHLSNYLTQAYHSQKRTILVITGKGKATAMSDDWLKPGEGILKKSVPEWLNQTPLSRIVLKFVSAMPKDGGSGALYVYLKRQR